MVTIDMDTSNDTAAAEQDGSSAESEPSRTCADITVEDDRWVSVAGLQELIPSLVSETVSAKLSAEGACVSIALLSDAEVRALNKAFRGKDTPTNVLSFPSAPPSGRARKGEPVFLGDVALAYETVVSEAEAQKKSALQHAAHLVVHGVLHLAGFDHGGEEEAERMEEAERAILAKFGVPDPYGDDELSLAPAH
jgi:probable rRNA maturation factor